MDEFSVVQATTKRTNRRLVLAVIAFLAALTVLVALGVAAGLTVVAEARDAARAGEELARLERARTARARADADKSYAEIRRIVADELRTKLDDHAAVAVAEHDEQERRLGELLARPVAERRVVVQRQAASPPLPTTTAPRPAVVTPTTAPATPSPTCPRLPNGRCRP